MSFDEVTGDIYRLEINKRITGRANHIRSVFKITPEQYNKIKLAEPRVLQPSPTALPEGGRKTMTIASFMRNITQNDGKSSRQSVNPEMELRTKRLVDMMKPFVSQYDELDGEYLVAKLKELYSVDDVSPAEAVVIAEEVRRIRKRDSIRRSIETAYAYFRQANPLFDFFMKFSDSQMINPGKNFYRFAAVRRVCSCAVN